jgi:hypothetical protein
MSRITAYCHLNEDYCSVNGAILARRDIASPDSWLKQLYKEQEFAYPKFHKMDTLSQAGIITTELIKRANSRIVTGFQDDEIALLFANKSSSSETDLRFRASYEQNGAPSPALFVYTLPNIVLGEIAILNKWYGENMFVVLPKFAPDFFVSYSAILISKGSKGVLGGWLDVSEGRTNAFVFFVEDNAQEGIEFDIANLSACAGFEPAV